MLYEETTQPKRPPLERVAKNIRFRGLHIEGVSVMRVRCEKVCTAKGNRAPEMNIGDATRRQTMDAYLASLRMDWIGELT